jgi:NAD(P)-dependent dehydrogenase (short-subunit alcohol dehydrogenase family)
MANKVCLITGGNSGIGKAAAIKFLLNGDSVIITSRSVERGKMLLLRLREIQ